jgi:hypothetical protein
LTIEKSAAKGLFDTEPLLSEAKNLARADWMLRLSAQPLQNSANPRLKGHRGHRVHREIEKQPQISQTRPFGTLRASSEHGRRITPICFLTV